MTNNSFSKISDLILPHKGRTGGQPSGRSQAPDSARAFQQLLQSVSDGDVLAPAARDRAPLGPTDPGRLDPMIDRPAVDRARPEPRSDVRPKPGQERDRGEVDQADGPGEDGAASVEARPDRAERAEADNSDDRDDRSDQSAPDDDGAADDEGTEAKAGEDGGEPSTDEESQVDGAEHDGMTDGVVAEMINGATADTSTTTTDQSQVDGDPAADTEPEAVVSPLTGGTSTEADGQPLETIDGVDSSATPTATADQVVQGPTATQPGRSTGEPTDGAGESTAEDVQVTVAEDGGTDVAASADGTDTTDGTADRGQAQDQNAEAEAESASPDGDGDGAGAEADTGTKSQDSGDQSGADGDGPLPTVTTATGSSTASAATNAAVGSITVGEVSATTRPNPTAPANPAGQMVDGEDGELIWRQVRRAIGSIRTNTNGDQQMTIRLRPAELGSVMIRVSTGDGGTTVALVAESAAAAGQLNQQRQQLINELEDGGLSGVAVDVGTSADADDQTGEADADGDESVPGRDRGSAMSQDPDTLDRYRIRRPGGTSAGLVDLDL